jgi:hypothetical protein
MSGYGPGLFNQSKEEHGGRALRLAGNIGLGILDVLVAFILAIFSLARKS